MSDAYEIMALSAYENELLQRVNDELLALAGCSVPSVRASARAALAHIAQALNGEGIAFQLYTKRLPE